MAAPLGAYPPIGQYGVIGDGHTATPTAMPRRSGSSVGCARPGLRWPPCWSTRRAKRHRWTSSRGRPPST